MLDNIPRWERFWQKCTSRGGTSVSTLQVLINKRKEIPWSTVYLFNIQPNIVLPQCVIYTLHCASYDTSYTVSPLPVFRALKEVHKLLLCSSIYFSVLCISCVSLETETIVTEKTVLKSYTYMKWINMLQIKWGNQAKGILQWNVPYFCTSLTW